jgi:hypothetical protein
LAISRSAASPDLAWSELLSETLGPISQNRP